LKTEISSIENRFVVLVKTEIPTFFTCSTET
jgi:hypothetical protein